MCVKEEQVVTLFGPDFAYREAGTNREAEPNVSTAMTAIEEPRLLHALPGRMRMQKAGWPREGHCAVEARLRQVPGVHGVQANPLTGNVLIHFDPTATDEQILRAVVQTLKPDNTSQRAEILPISPGVPRRQRRSRSAPGARLCLAGEPDGVGRASIFRNGRTRRLRLEMVDLILKAAGVAVSLILADSPLGLILSGVEAVRLCMKVIGRQRARRRGEVGQEHSLLMLIAPGDPGAVDVPEPIGRGRTRRYARARRRHRLVGGPAAV
jgi:copper chaperone CopZ